MLLWIKVGLSISVTTPVSDGVCFLRVSRMQMYLLVVHLSGRAYSDPKVYIYWFQWQSLSSGSPIYKADSELGKLLSLMEEPRLFPS